MTTTTDHHRRTASPHRFPRKPAVGRPVLFAVMLSVAALLLLAVLIAGPSLPIPLMIAAAVGALGLVVLSWTVAGPRL